MELNYRIVIAEVPLDISIRCAPSLCACTFSISPTDVYAALWEIGRRVLSALYNHYRGQQ